MLDTRVSLLIHNTTKRLEVHWMRKIVYLFDVLQRGTVERLGGGTIELFRVQPVSSFGYNTACTL